eukprot:145042-Ditylum_brightwellii.AAC.1
MAHAQQQQIPAPPPCSISQTFTKASVVGYSDYKDDSTNENDTKPTVPHIATTTKNEQKEDQMSTNNQNGMSTKEQNLYSLTIMKN